MSDDKNPWSNLGEGLEDDTVSTTELGIEELDTPISEERQAELAEEAQIRKMQERHDNTCPKCSWDIRDKVLKAKEEDLKEYTRCILADRNFIKRMQLYGGQLTVEFTEPSDATRDEIVRLAQGIPFDKVTQLDAITLTRKIQIVFALTKMSVGAQDKTWTVPEPGVFADAEEVATEFKVRLGGRSASMQSTLFRAYLEFDKLISVLSDGAFDENFYQGAGLD